MELKEQQINQFKDEGYLILSNFFDQYEVQALVIELERFYRQDLGRNVATDGDGETSSTTCTTIRLYLSTTLATFTGHCLTVQKSKRLSASYWEIHTSDIWISFF